jgi:hypothetical protein
MPPKPAMDVVSDLMGAREPLGRLSNKVMQATMLLAELSGRAHKAAIETAMEGDHTLVLKVPDAPKVYVAFSSKDATWSAWSDPSWSGQPTKTVVSLRWSRGDSSWTGTGRWTDQDGVDHHEQAVGVLAKDIESLVGTK